MDGSMRKAYTKAFDAIRTRSMIINEIQKSEARNDIESNIKSACEDIKIDLDKQKAIASQTDFSLVKEEIARLNFVYEICFIFELNLFTFNKFASFIPKAFGNRIEAYLYENPN